MNRERAATIGIAVLGIALGAVQLFSWADASLVELFATLPFVWMAGTIVYAGYWLARSDEYRPYADRVFVWTLGAAVAFGAVAVLVALAGDVASLTEASWGVVQTLTAGALAGTLVGLYDAQSRDRFDALQAERDRIEAFAHKAESLNHYGKALNQSSSPYEVSALAIEVLQLLIGSREAAVILVDDDGASVIDATLHDDRRPFLERVATSMATREPMSTVRSPGDVDLAIPDDLDVPEVLGVPVPTEGTETLVLVALPGSEQPYTDEDLDLLESLSSHVGTALSRVETDEIRLEP